MSQRIRLAVLSHAGQTPAVGGEPDRLHVVLVPGGRDVAAWLSRGRCVTSRAGSFVEAGSGQLFPSGANDSDQIGPGPVSGEPPTEVCGLAHVPQRNGVVAAAHREQAGRRCDRHRRQGPAVAGRGDRAGGARPGAVGQPPEDHASLVAPADQQPAGAEGECPHPGCVPGELVDSRGVAGSLRSTAGHALRGAGRGCIGPKELLGSSCAGPGRRRFAAAAGLVTYQTA